MEPSQILIINFEEIRRRSLILWEGVPREFYHWRPDKDALTCLEMVRHVLESEFLYHHIIQTGEELKEMQSPWATQPCISVFDELEFSQPYRKAFIESLRALDADSLSSVQIVRPGKKTRTLGDFLNRVAYHEAVHAGQLLSYLRSLHVPRPLIWD